MADDDRSLDELSHEQCWALLVTQQIARVGVNAEHYPLIFPVNFALDGEVIVFRTSAGPLLQAVVHANVTVQVDHVDAASRSGWSVLVRGLAEEVTERHQPEVVLATQRSGAQPWAPGERSHWVRVLPHRVTGRRIVPHDLPAGEPAGYL